MKKALLRKSIAAAVLLLVLAFSATAINTPLVKADAGGIGKFLTIEIEGGGSVTATKVKSGETWDFYWADPPMTEKVGAGTVLLEAKASEGWEFSHWEGDLIGTSVNPTEYKTEKYGYVRAVFVKITFTITAIVAPEAPNGYIETSVDGNPTQIWDQLDVTVEYGDSQTFSFYPDAGNHVSTIKIDIDFIFPALSYTFNDVQKDWTIVVFFSADGEAYVPAGTNVPVDLGGSVSLHFESTEGGGTATQASIDLPPLLVGTSLILWDVSAGVSFDGIVEIALPYSETDIQHVFRGDCLDELYCDVNADGGVDGDDVSDVANAIKSLTPQGLYDANFDVDRNGVLDENDIHLVNEYKGTTLQSLTFWVEGNTLYIETYLLSIFRGR
jgi:hypothetical protein